MTLSQLNKALLERFRLPKEKNDPGCFYVNSTKHPHVAFMIEDGKLVRIDIDGPGIFDEKHVQVGDSEASVLRGYDHTLKEEPNPYVPADVGHYLTARSRYGRYGIRFEIEKGKVRMYYAGGFNAVQYVEGCE
jgi:hypothetical protein